MMFNKNKKGYSTGLFGFFFVLMIISGLLLFLTFGMHFLLYDYGIKIAADVGRDITTSQSSAITTLEEGWLGLTQYYDILFLVVIVAAFIESTYAAIIAREAGWLSFFGFITIGNFALVFIMNFAIQIRGWFLNEIFFRILLVDIQAPIMTSFFNYSYYIGVLWFLWLITVNQVNLQPLKDLAQSGLKRVFRGRASEEGRFEK